MHLQIYALILVLCCSGTALTTALPQQSFNSGQNLEDIFSAYSSIPQDKWPRYKGQVIDPRCILNNLGKKHHKREWPRIPQPVYPSGYCPAWQQQTETETDREDRELCGDGFEPRCCAGEATGFGLGTMRSPCYQYMTSVHCKNFHNGETFCCEKFLPWELDGTPGFNCRPVTFASIPTFHASSSTSDSLLDNSFADTTKISPELPSDPSSDQELLFNSAAAAAAADWTADPSSDNNNNYINIASASNADLVGTGDSEVLSNPFWVD